MVGGGGGGGCGGGGGGVVIVVLCRYSCVRSGSDWHCDPCRHLA